MKIYHRESRFSSGLRKSVKIPAVDLQCLATDGVIRFSKGRLKCRQTPKKQQKDFTPSEWISDNYASLSDQYRGQYVAANSDGFIAHASTYAILIDKIAQKGIDPSSTTVAFIREDPTI